MKCARCKGTGNVKKKHFAVFNWPIAIIGFMLGPFFGEKVITEKQPGWVQEVKSCPDCKGSGNI